MTSKAYESFGLNASLAWKHMYIDLSTVLGDSNFMKGGDALLPDARLAKAHCLCLDYHVLHTSVLIENLKLVAHI